MIKAQGVAMPLPIPAKRFGLVLNLFRDKWLKSEVIRLRTSAALKHKREKCD